MGILYLILGVTGIALGSVLFKRNTALRPRLLGGGLALLGVVLLIFAAMGQSDFGEQRYADAEKRQGYAQGFGLGAYLAEAHANRQVLIVRSQPEEPRDLEIIRGLRDGLDGGLTVVDELAVPNPIGFQEQAAIFNKQRLTEMKATGADLVVSLVGLPVRIDDAEQVDPTETMALWRSPEYRAFQWVLPNPYNYLPPGSFTDGRVLVAVWPKDQKAGGEDFPAYLSIEGTPKELFDAWFELQTDEQFN